MCMVYRAAGGEGGGDETAIHASCQNMFRHQTPWGMGAMSNYQLNSKLLFCLCLRSLQSSKSLLSSDSRSWVISLSRTLNGWSGACTVGK